ncbi:MAG: hypothetical protein M1151_03550 [Candidatus Thermoplasmatota archaeon]|nr:hypothetical protein [Candidatus Thermoplasmatota archaeon]MCL5785730.1 hypothetical protein [Candidatus Thermoplasmatota archaeon]
MEDRVPSDRGEFTPVETPPAVAEAGSPRIYSWEEVTIYRAYPILKLVKSRSDCKQTIS